MDVSLDVCAQRWAHTSNSHFLANWLPSCVFFGFWVIHFYIIKMGAVQGTINNNLMTCPYMLLCYQNCEAITRSQSLADGVINSRVTQKPGSYPPKRAMFPSV